MSLFSRTMPSFGVVIFLPRTTSACPTTPTSRLQQLLSARLSTLRHLRSRHRTFATAPPPPAPKTRPIASLAQQLAAKGSPTHLYEAPPHTWFRIASLATGVFFISYAVLQYWAVYPKRDQLSTWILPAYGLICVAMSAAGTYFMMGGARIVRVIRALPSQNVTPRMLTGGGKTEAEKIATIGRQPLLMEVEIGRMVPLLMPARKLVVAPEEIVFPWRIERFGLPGASPTAGPTNARETVMARAAERDAARKLAKFDQEHLMTVPFRHGARAVTSIWVSIRRALTHEGFMPIHVAGTKYKIDVMGGWVLEHGRVLDRLVTVNNRD